MPRGESAIGIGAWICQDAVRQVSVEALPSRDPQDLAREASSASYPLEAFGLRGCNKKRLKPGMESLEAISKKTFVESACWRLGETHEDWISTSPIE